MQLIHPAEHGKALSLFQHSSHQGKLAALAEGGIEGRIWVDGDNPGAAIVAYQNKLMVACQVPPERFAGKLRVFLLTEVYQKRLGGGDDAQIFWDGEAAYEALLMALGDKCPAFTLREYWELDDPRNATKAGPPEGYEITMVDKSLLARGLENTDRLQEEMCSERVSVEEFLRHSFGVCAVKDGALAGWCLSEYNSAKGCEIGIETVDGHRQKGLARAMVSAFAEEAARRGVAAIGWHCFASNGPSRRTAQSAGLARVLEYGELICCYDTAVQYAVNGNLADSQARFEEAAAWYSRACADEAAPLWAYVRQAMTLTSLGRHDEAFASLKTGVARGLDWWDWLDSEPRLAPLRLDGRWQGLMEE